MIDILTGVVNQIDRSIMDDSGGSKGGGGGGGGARGLSFKQKPQPRRPSITPAGGGGGGVQLEIAVSCR